MKTLSVIILSIFVGLFLAIDTNAQTEIKFAKGKTFKTMKVTLPADGSKKFVISTGIEQVINIDLSGDIYLPKSKNMGKMPAVSVNLNNGTDADNWQDGEGYLSIFTGRKGKYVVELYNSDIKAHTFSIKVAVTNNIDDYRGGIDSQ